MDDFEEVRPLGRGAFGEVLLMKQTSTGLFCAVKKLGRATLTAGEEAEHLAEVKALQALQHPCILRYYGSIQSQDSLSLVMEFADSGDLQQLVKQQADSDRLYEVAALLSIFAQLVVAVAHVHAHRVLHRDLKPSNVMVTSSGRLKLGDFGVAKVLAGTTVMDNMTCVGSPTYMAPEIVSGEPYGAPCDVWSLGVILYELASFKRPFEGRSLGELVMRISSGQFQDIGTHLLEKPGGALVHEAVSPVLAKLLVMEQQRRARMPEVLRVPTLQVFATSMNTCAIVVASLLRSQDGTLKERIEEEPAVNELIADLAAKSPKRAAAAENLPRPGQVRSSLAKMEKMVEDDSLAFSLTNLSSSRPTHGTGEVSFSLTATNALSASATNALSSSATNALSASTTNVPTSKLPVLNQKADEVASAIAQKSALRASGGLGQSQDNHALRDVLGDALSFGGSIGSTRGQSPGPNPAQSQSLRSSAMGTRHMEEAILREAMEGPSAALQHTSEADVTAVGMALAVGAFGATQGEAGNVHFDHVSPGWKVKSSRRPDTGQSSSSSDASPPQSRAGRAEAKPLQRVREAQVSIPKPQPSQPSQPPAQRALKAGAVLGLGSRKPASDANMRRPSRTSSHGSHSSVTWPQMPEVAPGPRKVKIESFNAQLRSTTPPAGKPSTPESARQAKLEKERMKDRQRTGALMIPFSDSQPGQLQPPKGLQERMALYERKQKEKAEQAALSKGKASTTPERKLSRSSWQDARSRTVAR